MMHRHTLTETVEKYELSGASLKSVICMKWLPGFLRSCTKTTLNLLLGVEVSVFGCSHQLLILLASELSSNRPYSHDGRLLAPQPR